MFKGIFIINNLYYKTIFIKVNLSELKNKLSSYALDNILISKHALLRAGLRNFDILDIKKTINNPFNLYYFEEQKANFSNEKKFNCYFRHSKKYCHRFIIIINGKCIICTVIKINIKVQKGVDKNAKI